MQDKEKIIEVKNFTAAYDDNVVKDRTYISKGDTIDNLISDLKSCNWNKQNPAIDRLRKLIARTSNPSAYMRDIATLIQEGVLSNFNTGNKKDRKGKKWVKVSARYAKWKSSQGKDPLNILVLNSQLKNSISNGLIVNRTSAGVGTNVEYASLHNFGDSKSKMPAREFMHITAEVKKDIIKYITLCIMEE
jgi:phage virion morphogenesis protein